MFLFSILHENMSLNFFWGAPGLRKHTYLFIPPVYDLKSIVPESRGKVDIKINEISSEHFFLCYVIIESPQS